MLFRRLCLSAVVLQALHLVLELGHHGATAQNLRHGSRRQEGGNVHVRRRFLHCHEEGSSSAPVSNILDALLDGGLLPSQNRTHVTTNKTHDTASDRFADAEGEFGSGQSVGENPAPTPSSASPSPATLPPSPSSCPDADPEDQVSCQEGTLVFPSLCHAMKALGDELTGCLLVDSEPLVRDDDASGQLLPPSSCPDADPDDQVSCQQGTLTFPSLCHAKQELGEGLTDCILVDSDPLVRFDDDADDGASGTARVQEDEDPTILDPSQLPSAAASLASLDCSEAGEQEVAAKVPVICSGDMIFSSWCDALRRGFIEEDCQAF